MSDTSNLTPSINAEVTNLIRSWEEEHSEPNYNPIPTLTRLAEICEVETENYLKMDPDPFDERHPSRTDPDCKLGQILKALFRKDNFMNKLVSDYLRDTYYSRSGISQSVDQLNIAACRLMLGVMPGLETTVVFQPDMDSLIQRLVKWTTNSVEPLQSYATGLLAAAMEIPDIATRFREQNYKLMPLLLQRLRRLQAQSDFIVSLNASPTPVRPFAHLSAATSPPFRGDAAVKHASVKRYGENSVFSPRDSNHADAESGIRRKRQRLSRGDESAEKVAILNETSNSSWAELESFMIGTVQIFPPTLVTRQVLILKYLAPMGEYQEFLIHAFEHDALGIIMKYVNVRKTKEARLAFEALKYLASLLCHKKFSIEFIQCDAINALLDIPRPSIAATGVSICLYYLAYCEESMERICLLLERSTINRLVRYALWLLECSHDSGRCHAIMFFGLTFQFKVILDEFDALDGLRMLHNVIATLQILLPDNDRDQLNEDEECASRQIVRHVCLTYRRYLEVHLNAKVKPFRQHDSAASSGGSSPAQHVATKASKATPEEIQEHVQLLMEHLMFNTSWAPVDYLFKLGGITLLLKIIAFAYEWNYGGRAETVRSALDVLAIACVMPKVQALFCEKIDLPEESTTFGMNIILGAAEGEIVADAEVQKAALRVIVNCVCTPINQNLSISSKYAAVFINSPVRKTKVKNTEELIQKVWDCVRANSGIMVLLQLMNIKTPITDADCIRTLACKALAGLARSETVRQIVSKLPLFTTGNLQTLMRNPILQEKRQEHVLFQKYAFELLVRLSGKSQQRGYDLEASLANIHRASVVAQTKIQFNDKQLLQLIHQHLISKNCFDTAATLIREANLSHSVIPLSVNQPSKFRYSTSLTPARARLSIMSTPHRQQSDDRDLSSTQNGACTTPIKLIKKQKDHTALSTPMFNSRLQKQTNNDMIVRTSSQETSAIEQPRVSLNSIITEYLANQHSLCKNPMATCPKFNLFNPHKCPDPKPGQTTSNNIVMRCARRAVGYDCVEQNRKFVHSRFCPVQTIRSPLLADGDYFTCARFLPNQNSIIVGDYSGDIRLFNLHSGNEEFMFQAHDNYVAHIEPNRTGEFLLTSATWGRPLSALWAIRGFEMKFALDNEEYIEYSKVSQDRILATKVEAATIYDASTGLQILRLIPSTSNQYTRNKATFSYCDNLVLSDGVIFDVRSSKQIHKLDKLNQTQSGVFHPNGLEIVSNTEVWDMRTFHLLKTVALLNQCNAIFSNRNNTIYGITMEQELDDGESTFDTSFKTLDAIDYSSITTMDVKRNIYDLAVNLFDTQIAIVENVGLYQTVQESVVRIYDVGRKRDVDDEQNEEEEDNADMDGSDDDGSDNEDILDRDFNDLMNNALGNLDVVPRGGDNNEHNSEGEADGDEEDDEGDTFTLSGSDSDSDSWTSISSGGSTF